MSELVSSKVSVKICKDKKDNKFLECALAAGADYLISGDKHLLELKKYKRTAIVTTSKMLNLLK